MSPKCWSRFRQLQSDPACASQAELHGCDSHRASACSEPPHRRGLAGPGLLAHVLVAKYADHQPLYRQAEMYAREGVELERSTLADWVGGTQPTARASGAKPCVAML